MSGRNSPQPSELLRDRLAIRAMVRSIAQRAHDLGMCRLLDARLRLTFRYPGCALAILNEDAALNWDRGALMRAEMAAIDLELWRFDRLQH